MSAINPALLNPSDARINNILSVRLNPPIFSFINKSKFSESIPSPLDKMIGSIFYSYTILSLEAIFLEEILFIFNFALFKSLG